MATFHIPTLEVVVAAHSDDASGLVAALRHRENAIVGLLQELSVVHFGLHPQIVAEVFTNFLTVFGTEADDATKALVHQQYLSHIEDLRRQQGEG